MPVPAVTIMSNDEDEVDLAAVERVAAAQLARDLAAAKKRNERIAQKKQERVDLLRKQKEDQDAREAQRKLDEAAKAKRKVPVEPPVRSFFVSSRSRQLTCFPGRTGGSV